MLNINYYPTAIQLKRVLLPYSPKVCPKFLEFLNFIICPSSLHPRLHPFSYLFIIVYFQQWRYCLNLNEKILEFASLNFRYGCCSCWACLLFNTSLTPFSC